MLSIVTISTALYESLKQTIAIQCCMDYLNRFIPELFFSRFLYAPKIWSMESSLWLPNAYRLDLKSNLTVGQVASLNRQLLNENNNLS